MDTMKQAFLALPDTVIITDRYLRILDFNRSAPFAGLKKGAKLTDFIPDFHGEGEDGLNLGNRTYQQRISAVREGGVTVGYTVYLADTTDMTRLLAQNRQKSRELGQLIEKQRRANAELSEYVRQAQALADYTEQLRIAQHIHDDAGHAMTAVHTISQMCLRIRNADRKQYDALLAEGISLCEQAMKTRTNRRYASLQELLEAFRKESPFPITVAVSGTEPVFAAGLYDTVYAVCREAHHNTLSHSLADRQSITAVFTEKEVTLSVFDNGRFHGAFVKGFGLSTLCERVRHTGGTLRFHAAEGEGFGIIAQWRDKDE